MNEQRLESLTARAKKATEIAERIKVLKAADPYQSVTLSFKHWNTGDVILETDLLKEVIVEGCRVLIERAEQELESLIVVEPEVLVPGA